MRLGILFFLVFLAIIYQYQCEETNTDAVSDTDSDTTTVEPVTEKPKSQKQSNRKKDDDDDDEDENKKDDDNKKDDEEDEAPKKRPSKKDNKKDAERSKGKKRGKTPDSLGYINVYFKNKKKGTKKDKTMKVRLPVARYNRERYPRFGPLTTFLPWLPIYVERRTKQTVIYSPAGGVYILPPVVNFYGKTFSVGELIASGYVSLVGSGAPPPPSVDVAPLVHTGAVTGPNMPTIDPNTGAFNGAVTTDFRAYSYPSGGYYVYQ